MTVRAVVKNKGKISQNIVAFSEYMNFNEMKYVINDYSHEGNQMNETINQILICTEFITNLYFSSINLPVCRKKIVFSKMSDDTPMIEDFFFKQFT